MIPLGDDVEHDQLPVGGFVLIALNLVLFFYLMRVDADHVKRATAPPNDFMTEFMAGDASAYLNNAWQEEAAEEASLPSSRLIEQWGLTGATLTQGQFGRIFSHMFVHDGLRGLIGNILVLSALMWTLEAYMGTGRFLILYLGSGALAALGELILNPEHQQTAIGSSGAIAGVIGAYCLRFGSSTNIHVYATLLIRTHRFNVPASLFAIGWIALQWQAAAFASLLGATTVGWFAHIAGFFAGMTLAGILSSDGKLIVQDQFGKKRIVAAQEELLPPGSAPTESYGDLTADDVAASPTTAAVTETLAPLERCAYCGQMLTDDALVAPTLFRCPAPNCGRMHIAKASLPANRGISVPLFKRQPVGR